MINRMSDVSETDIMSMVRAAGKKPDASALSSAIRELRFRGFLTDINRAIIEKWIKLEFPKSIKYLATEMLKGEDEEEKEKEEKIPSWDARNICSGSTQNDLSGGPMPRDLNEVTSFLLPKGGKSECITEADLRMLLRPKSQLDEIYLYNSTRDRAETTMPVHRLPSSGIWILGYTPYLRMFRAYQLEFFRTHLISAKQHTVSGIWKQTHDIYVAKPLHYEDFKALIIHGKSLPPTPSACMCMFGPKLEDWSTLFRANYNVEKCGYIIPTWNGFPVVLGTECGRLIPWNYDKITLPAAERISIEPETEEKEEEKEEKKDENYAELASKIVDGYWDIINKKLILFGTGKHKVFDQFPIDGLLRLSIGDQTIYFIREDVDTVSGRDEVRQLITTELKNHGIINKIEWSTSDEQLTDFPPTSFTSESAKFNPDTLLRISKIRDENKYRATFENPIRLE